MSELITSPKLPSLSVFLPCYNEEANLEPMVKSLLHVLPQVAKKAEIILINDGSLDGTGRVADRLSRQYPIVRVIHHPHNRGYGATLRTGFFSAKYSWVLFTDSDRQFDVAELVNFIPYTTTYDAVIGYRKTRAEGGLRALNARLFKLFIDLLFRVHVRDIDCAFKLFKTALVQNLPFTSTGAMISSELLYRLKKKGVHFKQLPVSHYPRTWGSPTGNNLKVVYRAGVEAVKLYLSIKFRLNL